MLLSHTPNDSIVTSARDACNVLSTQSAHNDFPEPPIWWSRRDADVTVCAGTPRTGPCQIQQRVRNCRAAPTPQRPSGPAQASNSRCALTPHRQGAPGSREALRENPGHAGSFRRAPPARGRRLGPPRHCALSLGSRCDRSQTRPPPAAARPHMWVRRRARRPIRPNTSDARSTCVRPAPPGFCTLAASWPYASVLSPGPKIRPKPHGARPGRGGSLRS